MKGIKSISDIGLADRRVLMRLDLDVPVKDGQVVSDARIRAALPTIRHALEAEAGLVLCSHFGQPAGTPTPESTLEPVGMRLSELLNQDVVLADDCIGDGVKALVKDLRPGKILMLENLAHHAGELENEPEFVRQFLAPFDLIADVYINDAFGACHRHDASIVGIAKNFQRRGAGFLLGKEIKGLGKLLHESQKPFVAVFGGTRLADKVSLISTLLTKIDTLCIGGAMAFTFLKARGLDVGRSPVEHNMVEAARNILTRAEGRGIKVLLPQDHLATEVLEEAATATTVHDPAIRDPLQGFDIGPKTVRQFERAVSDAKSVFWYGPMGVFEHPAFARGSAAVATATASCRGYTVVAGRETVAALEAAGVARQIGHVSTGSGAALALLEHGTLPGIEALIS